MVRAAYSSGKPTFAVGAGNVPVYIHRSVKDVKEAALMAITSKSFDNGTACVAEQSIVLDEPIADAGMAAFAAQGTYFLNEAIKAARTSSAEKTNSDRRQWAFRPGLSRRINVKVPVTVEFSAQLGKWVPAPLSRNSRTCLPHRRLGCRIRVIPAIAVWRKVHARSSLRDDERSPLSASAGRIVINTPAVRWNGL
jgi:acetaldehyde dehydrogenase (acetylating)